MKSFFLGDDCLHCSIHVEDHKEQRLGPSFLLTGQHVNERKKKKKKTLHNVVEN